MARLSFAPESWRWERDGKFLEAGAGADADVPGGDPLAVMKFRAYSVARTHSAPHVSNNNGSTSSVTSLAKLIHPS